jgi:hypothetical protein
VVLIFSECIGIFASARKHRYFTVIVKGWIGEVEIADFSIHSPEMGGSKSPDARFRRQLRKVRVLWVDDVALPKVEQCPER